MSVALGSRRGLAGEVAHSRRALLWALLAAEVLIVALVVQQTIDGWNSDHVAEALLPRLLVVCAFPVAGLWVVRRPGAERLGLLLLGVGVLAGLAMLSGSADSRLYTLGRFTVACAEVAIVYLVLCYPSGALSSRRERWMVGALAAVLVLAWIPSLLVSPQIGAGGVLVRCGNTCPSNAAVIWAHPDLGRGLALVMLVGLLAAMVGVLVTLGKRFGSASPVRRRGLAVVTAASGVYAVSLGAFAVIKSVAPHSYADSVAGWATVLTAAAVPLSILVALVRERLFANRVMLKLFHDLDAAPDARTYRRAVCDAVDDPALLLALPDAHGGLVDLAGAPIPRTEIEGRAVTVVDQGATPLMVVHDPALEDDPQLFEAVCSSLAVAYDRSLQRDRVRGLLDDVRESRARLATARDIERRRIERDLHDGAQQRLVAVRLRLGLARGHLEPGSTAEQLLEQVDSDLTDAVAQLRDLARGIYPPVLESDGLAEALRAAAQHTPLPITVTPGDVGRFGAAIEAAVYFSCVEAMQNSAKHGGEGTMVDIQLSRANGALVARVSDTGRGFDPGSVTGSSGLLNIRDRIESIGGAVVISSAPGRGTTVSMSVPLDPPAP